MQEGISLAKYELEQEESQSLNKKSSKKCASALESEVQEIKGSKLKAATCEIEQHKEYLANYEQEVK
jgi:hypothetical protein